ncbi:hypothetical protein [Kurthia senegalensis]|nr:hypothetical protein [Kurthia senegalensis]
MDRRNINSYVSLAPKIGASCWSRWAVVCRENIVTMTVVPTAPAS